MSLEKKPAEKLHFRLRVAFSQIHGHIHITRANFYHQKLHKANIVLSTI